MGPQPAYVYLVVLAVLSWMGLSSAEKVALVEITLQGRQGISNTLRGEVIEGSLSVKGPDRKENDNLKGDLRLMRDDVPLSSEKGEAGALNSNERNPWIGVVPVEVDDSISPAGSQESFATAIVNKMKRALVLGASALIILALNQNSVREMDLSQVLSKPIIVIQTSENVTKLIGALLRGLHATAKITYKTFLKDNLGATLTLWSSCGRSRGGLYGEWQGVICTGESNSQVQKYLHQLWNTVVLVALIFTTGILLQSRWQNQDRPLSDDPDFLQKQDIVRRLSTLKTRTYLQPKTRDPSQIIDTDDCAVCLEQFNNNQCLRVLPCQHEFHMDCVDPWLLLQQTCPLCKRSVLGNCH